MSISSRADWLLPLGLIAPGAVPIAAGAVRLLQLGAATALFLCRGVAAIRRGDVPRHAANMMRAPAMGLGAGTQVLTGLSWSLFSSIQSEAARTFLMGAGWAVNLAVAQLIISRQRGR